MHRFLIDNATADLLPAILVDDAPCVRIARHIPSATWGWWRTAVPLSRGGAPRQVLIRALEFDLELPTEDFVGWLDDFRNCGLDLVQSDAPLPPTMDRSRFSDDEAYLRVLGQCGARLRIELPHPQETAGLVFFCDKDVARFERSGIGRPQSPAH